MKKVRLMSFGICAYVSFLHEKVPLPKRIDIYAKAGCGLYCRRRGCTRQECLFIPGVIGSAEYSMQNVDGFAFNGGVAFNLANVDNGVSVGLNYNLQASEHETGHMLNASFRYDF